MARVSAQESPDAGPAREERGEGHLVPKSRVLLVAAIGACVLGALQLSNLVPLPFEKLVSEGGGSILSSESLLGFMRTYGYLGLFALMTLESASLPIPSEVILPFAGYLYYLEVFGFWEAVAVATVGAVAGALIDYYLARVLGRPFVARMLRAFGVGQRGLDRAEGWFERSGRWTVFAARFVPGLRALISLPAGLFRMELREFVALTTVGCVAWNIVLVYGGYLAAKLGETTLASGSLVDWIATGALGIGALYVAYFFVGRRARGSGASRGPSGS